MRPLQVLARRPNSVATLAASKLSLIRVGMFAELIWIWSGNVVTLLSLMSNASLQWGAAPDVGRYLVDAHVELGAGREAVGGLLRGRVGDGRQAAQDAAHHGRERAAAVHVDRVLLGALEQRHIDAIRGEVDAAARAPVPAERDVVVRRGAAAQVHRVVRFEADAGIRRDDGAGRVDRLAGGDRSEEHTSELQSPLNLVCRLLLEKKKVYEVSAEYVED